MAASYHATAEAAHAAGKSLVVHTGGPRLRLLPLLAETGVDVVEGIAPPPQGDATLVEARAATPDLMLWGGIPQDYLMDARTEDEFVAAVADAPESRPRGSEADPGRCGSHPLAGRTGPLAPDHPLISSALPLLI